MRGQISTHNTSIVEILRLVKFKNLKFLKIIFCLNQVSLGRAKFTIYIKIVSFLVIIIK